MGGPKMDMVRSLLKKMNKHTVIVIMSILILFFIVDPYKWWPIEHLVGKNKAPCTTEDIRPTCTGKIIFFWQKP